MGKSAQIYRSRVWAAAVKAFSRHFGGWKKVVEPLGISGLTAVSSILAISVSQGRVTMSDIGIAILSVVSGLLWVFFIFVMKLIQAPYLVFREITRNSPCDIEINPYYPPTYSVQRPGLLIENNKDVTIENCRCSLVYLQIEKIIPDFLQFPYHLAWIKDEKLEWGTIGIATGEKSLVAVQTWDKPPSRNILHTKLNDEERDCGPATGIEIGERGGLAVYKDKYYKAGFRLDFSIGGKVVDSSTYFFELKFDGENIKLKKLKSLPTD